MAVARPFIILAMSLLLSPKVLGNTQCGHSELFAKHGGTTAAQWATTVSAMIEASKPDIAGLIDTDIELAEKTLRNEATRNAALFENTLSEQLRSTSEQLKSAGEKEQRKLVEAFQKLQRLCKTEVRLIRQNLQAKIIALEQFKCVQKTKDHTKIDCLNALHGTYPYEP